MINGFQDAGAPDQPTHRIRLVLVRARLGLSRSSAKGATDPQPKGTHMDDTNPQNIKIHDVDFSIRAINALLNLHEYGCRQQPPVPCHTLGDITKLSQAEILRTPNCGKVTLKEIEDVLAKFGLCLKEVTYQTSKMAMPTTASIIRNKELEAINERLMRELGYLQGKAAQTDMLEEKIAKLETELHTYQKSERRAWDRFDEIRKEQEITRSAASEAIRQLQAELERVKTQK